MKTAIAVAMWFVTTLAVEAIDSVDWRDVGTSIQIVGRLGVPIGTVVKIEATLLSSEDVMKITHDPFRHVGRYLRVDVVEGVPCEDRPIMSFVDHSDDYVESLDPQESKKMDEDFKKRTPSGAPIGTKFTLYAFEMAYTSRNPRGEIPDGTFGYSSELVDPGVDVRTFFRTRLNVALPQTAQPGATDNPDDAQRVRED